MKTDPTKVCAACVQGLICQKPREPNSLFCGQHKRACNRMILFTQVPEEFKDMKRFYED